MQRTRTQTQTQTQTQTKTQGRLRSSTFLPQLRVVVRNLALFTCVISSAEATFGHEHVHIRVHVPQIKNEIRHTEKAIVKEIPIIRHRYKERIIGAGVGAGAAHLYRYEHNNAAHVVHGNSNNHDSNIIDSIDSIDDDDDMNVNENADGDYTGFAVSGRAADHRGFRHRNLYAIDDGDGDVSAITQPTTYLYSYSYSHSHPLRDERLEQPDTSSSSIPLLHRRPFAIAMTSSGRDGDDDGHDYRYPKTWPMTAAAPIKDDTNLSALYKLVKNYTPSTENSDAAHNGFHLDQVIGVGGNSRHRQNVFDYYHIAPAATDDETSVNQVDADDYEDKDDDDDDDDSNELPPFELNSKKLKLKNYSSSNYEIFKAYNNPSIGTGHSLPPPPQNLATGNHAYPSVHYAWPS